jgi:hypothetical protein
MGKRRAASLPIVAADCSHPLSLQSAQFLMAILNRRV